jgi:hypothetical protein
MRGRQELKKKANNLHSFVTFKTKPFFENGCKIY